MSVSALKLSELQFCCNDISKCQDQEEGPAMAAEGFVEQQGPNHIVRIRQDQNLDELFKVAIEGTLISTTVHIHTSKISTTTYT